MKQVLKVMVLCSALCSMGQAWALGHKIYFKNSTGRPVQLYFYKVFFNPTFELTVGGNSGASDELSLEGKETDWEKINSYDGIVAIKVYFDDRDRREALYSIGGDIIDALRKGVTGSEGSPAFIITEKKYSAIGIVPKMSLSAHAQAEYEKLKK